MIPHLKKRQTVQNESVQTVTVHATSIMRQYELLNEPEKQVVHGESKPICMAIALLCCMLQSLKDGQPCVQTTWRQSPTFWFGFVSFPPVRVEKSTNQAFFLCLMQH